MKTRVFSSIIIFISAYSPLAIIIAIQDLTYSGCNSTSQKSIINIFNNPLITWSFLIISVASLFILYFVMRNITNGHLIQVKSISNRSSELVNYTIPYMISFFGFDLFEITELISFLIFMILLCVLTIKTQAVFINPILAMSGYGNYDIEYEENGVTKEGVFISKIKPVKEGYYQIQKVTDYSYIITEDQNNETN